MKIKKIISLILALSLAVGSVLSLSSCFSAIDLYMDYLNREDDGNDVIPDGEGGNGDESKDEGGSQGGSQGSGNINNSVPEFYPSPSGGSLDGVSVSSLPILSCVTVTSRFTTQSSYPGYDGGSSTAEGAGVIYKLDREKGDAYIITNYHVVYSGKVSNDISVYLYGQESEDYAIDASFVGGSLTQDLAVLKVSGSEILKNSSALPVTVADSSTVAVMDSVVAIGNPEAAGMSVTTGIVSVDSESLAMIGADGRTALSLRVIRISAAINEGNSGGGLFNADGELIGIVNAKKTGSEIDNIAYAIPSNVAVNIAENIIHYCNGSTVTSLYKCQLGISLTAKVMGVVVDPDSSKITKAEIVEIAEVLDTCVIADKVAAGDRINSITVDGVTKTVTRIHHVTDHMLTARVGSVVVLNITRGGQTFDVTVTVPESALITVK